MSVNSMPKENKMGTMPVKKLIFNMALPLIISMLIQALYNIVDSIFVSRISEDALTAVSLVFPVQNLMIAFATGTGVGMNALLSRRLGEKNREAAEEVANVGLLLSICTAVVFALFGVFGSQLYFSMQKGVSPIIAEYGAQYLSIVCIGSIGIFVEITAERMLQGTGQTLITMFIQGIGAIINIILDPIMIFGLLGCPAMGVRGAAAAQYIKDNNMVDTVGILYQSDNDYSVGLYNAFVAKCGELGITIAETQTFTSSTNTDFSTQVSALVSSGVKLVFIPLYAEEASTFLTQAHGKFADDVYFFGADGLDGILGKVEQDTSLANNVLMLTPFAADNPAENVQSFVKKYQEAYGATPDQFAADAYDAIYAIKAAVEKAGSTSGAALASALTSLTVEGVTGTMTWGSDGNTNKPASAILYYDGVGTLFDSQD